MHQTATEAGEMTIWERIMERSLNARHPEVARSLLSFRFSDKEKDRMNELAHRNEEGLLTGAERRELEAYVNVGDMLALIHSKAQEWLENNVG